MMRYSSRFWLYAPISLFLALAAWVMVHWWLVAGAFDRKLHALKGHEAIPGVTLDWSKVTISGFPFRVDAVFENFAATGAGAHGAFAWRGDGFALHFLTYGRAQYVFEASGRQNLRWTGADGAAHALALLPGALQASAVTDARGLARFDLHILDAGGPRFTAADLQFHLRRDPNRKDLDLMAGARALNGKDTLAPFGSRITALGVYAHLGHVEGLNPLLAGAASWPQVIQAWEAGGGTLVVDKADVASQGLKTHAPDARLGAIFAPLY